MEAKNIMYKVLLQLKNTYTHIHLYANYISKSKIERQTTLMPNIRIV